MARFGYGERSGSAGSMISLLLRPLYRCDGEALGMGDEDVAKDATLSVSKSCICARSMKVRGRWPADVECDKSTYDKRAG